MPLARLRAFAFAWVVALAACGGGGGSDPPASSASATPVAAEGALCGVPTGPHVITGTVSRVHDGDTITVADARGETDVRLQGIDAPELAQPFGPESRSALHALLAGRPVRVAYAASDDYQRALGEVFTADCKHVNLAQLAAGMAWFYQAFQCELPAALRDRFAHAQQQARGARAGLWSQRDPQPPWVFRNGHEQEVPACGD